MKRRNNFELDTKSANEKNYYFSGNNKEVPRKNIVANVRHSPVFQSSRESLFNEFNRLMNEFFDNDHFLSEFSQINKTVGKWPKIDLEEDDENYYVVFAAPGFNDDEISVELKKGSYGYVLVITAEKKKEEKQERRHYSEIRYSKGQRVIPLAGCFREEVDVDKIKANKNNNGTTSIVLPKIEKNEDVNFSKKIDIE